MSQNSKSQYRLTPAAQTDLEDIWYYTAQKWSIDQADRYLDTLENTFAQLLAMPEIARERPEFNPPVRIHPSAEHIVVYRIEPAHIEVIRILGGKQNWHSILRVIDQ
jgi:toxin ParE1/3/4